MPPVDSARIWKRADQLFAELVDLPEGERSATIDALDETPGVKTAVRQLLDSLGQASVLDGSVDELFDPKGMVDESLQGQKFGDWVIGEAIGHGGMSVVYEATRTGERFEQHAVFKKLSIAFLSTRHVESFHRECEALATLDHPGIARLIHSDLSPGGTPYLIIERVRGQPIDQYCKENSLDINAIVRLIELLCGAVAHAHRHLIVHRDINPSNVLVDGRGNPRLLDFGVAKMLDSEAGLERVHAYTPGYAAPEQIADEVITTATDVYGLGRLLSRLLRHHPPDRELAAIVAMATQDDVELRYTSASELAEDLEAWLSNRPVSAIPDSPVYRLRKYTRRNMRWLSLAAIAILVLGGGIASTVHQANATRIEAARHRAVAGFMLDLFQQADLMQSGADLRVTELLETAAARAPEQLADQPDALASLYNLIASGQIELTNYDHAAEVLLKAESLIESENLSVTTIADFEVQRGREAYELGRFSEAVEHLKTAVKLLAGSDHSEMYFTASANLVSYLVDAESYKEALVVAEKLAEEMPAAELDYVTQSMVTHRYAVALEVNGDVDAAFQKYREALEIQSTHDPDNHLGRASILNDYGIALYLSNQQAEAEQVYREVLTLFTEQFETPHPRISSSLHNLAFSIAEQGRTDEAIVLLRQAYDMSVELHGPDHIDSLLEQATLANVMVRANMMEDAESLLRANILSLEKVAPDMKVQQGAVHSYLADLLMRTGRLEESRKQYQAALALFTELTADHPRVIEAEERLEELDTKGLIDAGG